MDPKKPSTKETLKRMAKGAVVGGVAGYAAGMAVNVYQAAGHINHIQDTADYLQWIYAAFGTNMSADEIRLFRYYLGVIGNRVSRSG